MQATISSDAISATNTGDPNGSSVTQVTTLDVPQRELTVAEKEQRIREILIEEGSNARETGENVNWRIGRAAVKYAQTFVADSDGNIDEKKLKIALGEYAVSIGMIDNKGRVTQCYNVAHFWPEASQAHFKDVSWTRFQTCAKHCRDLSHASTVLHTVGHEPVAKVREAILGKPSPRPVSASFAATVSDGLGSLVRFNVTDVDRFWSAVLDHPKATVELVVTWTEEATA